MFSLYSGSWNPSGSQFDVKSQAGEWTDLSAKRTPEQN